MDKTQTQTALRQPSTAEAISEAQQNELQSQELYLSLFQIRFLMHAATPQEDTAPQCSFQQMETWKKTEQLRRRRTPLPMTGNVANQILQIKELERLNLIQPQDLGRGRQAWQLTLFGKMTVHQHLYITESYQRLMQL